MAQREDERETIRARRDEREAAKRAEREQEKAEAAQVKRVSEEHALVAILRQRPGIYTDELRGALAAALEGCNRDRMRNILARLGDAVVTRTPEKGPANARAYGLDESALREEFRTTLSRFLLKSSSTASTRGVPRLLETPPLSIS